MELALTIPVLLLLLLGVIEVGNALNAYITVVGAARDGARCGVTGRTDCNVANPDRLACIQYVAKEATAGLYGAPNNVTVTVKSWDYPGYTQEHDGSAGDQCDALEVMVNYDFEFAAPIISNLLGGPMHITIPGKERMVNEPFGLCQ